ncbi:NACHT domain-containing protein [Plantactinospora sp. CA-294935]|uniref:NACHT domain-containing protein n=1 Tax=Plantactinospora sp. CA-294935 TaxID=3240012 RepID=UPI003D8DEC87
MADTFSYADAVRLLGGGNSPVVTALDNLAGGVLLGGSLLVPGMLALFDAKAEFARLSRELVGKANEQWHRLGRYDRTERLAAAHSVLVVTAFFEALAESDLPFSFAELKLTRDEQLLLSGHEFQGAVRSPLTALFASPVPRPAPHEPYDDFRARLGLMYGTVTGRLWNFVPGLAVWEKLRLPERAAFAKLREPLPERAMRRYDELFGRLAADFPEVAFWAQVREHEGTRADVREVLTVLRDAQTGVRDLGTSLAGLERVLARVAAGRDAADLPDALRRAYTDTLNDPVVESGEVPDWLSVPALGQAYVPPLCRIAELTGDDSKPSDESWWMRAPVRADLPEFLLGYLTSPRATRAPLLVLGQPGSGKSVLTRTLAARLPAADFLVVRVELRNVSALTDLQDQIETAVRDVTGERMDWPALAGAAGGALPVILLDGFDELLQATGISQSDYLDRVARFQRREGVQGRPAVVVVTSRTSVADRAVPPDGTVAVRLEPFDAERVGAWLDVWNAVNAENFARRDVAPLAPDTVLAHGKLAEQPLLLLMLALYDADGNALRDAGQLRRDELYERLLDRFARREVSKHRAGLDRSELDAAIAAELYRLSVVAFALFNRGAQWVTKKELDDDLVALLGPDPSGRPADDRRPALRPAEVVLGRFFFVHRSRVTDNAASSDDDLETYEFLHATFGEYLVARLVWHVLSGMVAARQAAAGAPFGMPFGDPQPVDDGRLHALTSWAALCGRAPVVEFLTGMMSTLNQERRDFLVELLIGLFRAASWPRTEHRYDRYQPRPLPVPARHAAYSVNLLLLAVCAAGTLPGSTLYGAGVDVVPSWHRHVLLWRSQLLSADWTSFVRTMALDRIGMGESRDIHLRLAGPDETPPPIDLAWTMGPAWPDQQPDHVPRVVSFRWGAREVNILCGVGEDMTQHALDPLVARQPDAVKVARVGPASPLRSEAHELIALLLTPLSETSPTERLSVYQRWLRVCDFRLHEPLPLTLLLERLAADTDLPAPVAVAFLSGVTGRARQGFATVRRLPPEPYLRCVRAWLGRDEDADRELARLVRPLLSDLLHEPDRPQPGAPVAVHLRAVLDELERLDLLDEAGVDATIPPIQRLIDTMAVGATEPTPPG